jgi:hypothetical protein
MFRVTFFLPFLHQPINVSTSVDTFSLPGKRSSGRQPKLRRRVQQTQHVHPRNQPHQTRHYHMQMRCPLLRRVASGSTCTRTSPIRSGWKNFTSFHTYCGMLIIDFRCVKSALALSTCMQHLQHRQIALLNQALVIGLTLHSRL